MASKVLDLNQDQQDELLIGTTSSTGDGNLTVYVAIYGLVDGKVVDLTKDILEKDTDSPPFFPFLFSCFLPKTFFIIVA